MTATAQPSSPSAPSAAPPAQVARRASDHVFATRPTAFTRFLRTFVLWQAVRFVVINLKMVRIIFRSHR